MRNFANLKSLRGILKFLAHHPVMEVAPHNCGRWGQGPGTFSTRDPRIYNLEFSGVGSKVKISSKLADLSLLEYLLNIRFIPLRADCDLFYPTEVTVEEPNLWNQDIFIVHDGIKSHEIPPELADRRPVGLNFIRSSPFSVAASHGNIEAMRMIYERSGLGFEELKFIDALREASAMGYVDIVDWLIQIGKDLISQRGMGALRAACSNGRIDVVERLLQAGVDPNAEPLLIFFPFSISDHR